MLYDVRGIERAGSGEAAPLRIKGLGPEHTFTGGLTASPYRLEAWIGGGRRVSSYAGGGGGKERVRRAQQATRPRIRARAWAWIATASALMSPGVAAIRSATSAWSMTTSSSAKGGPEPSRWRKAGELMWYGRFATTVNAASKALWGSNWRMSAVSTVTFAGSSSRSVSDRPGSISIATTRRA